MTDVHRSWSARRGRDQAGTGAASFAVLLVGAGLLVVGLNGHAPRWLPPPVPPQSVVAGQAPVHHARHSAFVAGLARSVPVALSIPAIGVSSRVIGLGITPDGDLAVPPLSAAL